MAAPLEPARKLLAEAVAVVPHTDADGLAAGAIALRARGETAADAVLLGRGLNPFRTEAPLPTGGALAVLDWGVRRLNRPALFVDHHAPEAEPSTDQIVVSGHGEDPEVSTSVLMRRLVPESPAWLAALGAVSDLGSAALALPECAGARGAQVRRLSPLVNAPRRIDDGPVELALALLVESDDPATALADPRAETLREAHALWRAELAKAMRVAPKVHATIAVIRVSSSHQVHPAVATAWSRRLAPRPVLVANDAYLPGRINFAVRGGSGDLRRLLREALPDLRGEFAHGHPRATGGSLEPEQFERLLTALGAA